MARKLRSLALILLILMSLAAVGCNVSVGVGVGVGYPGRWGGPWRGPIYMGGPFY